MSDARKFVTSLYESAPAEPLVETTAKTAEEPADRIRTELTASAFLQTPLVWCAPVSRRGGRWHWQTLAEAGLIILLFPIVIYGEMALGPRNALAISLVVIACVVALFMFLFDTRRPNPRELVVIATLIALAVAGRSVFFMLPQFKPVAAIVIISGISLGQETGFIVGALTALVSNVFFGQGPWTAWQMIAFGLVGFVAGVLHRTHVLPAKRGWLCVYGFLSIFFIYGLIMNPASLLMYSSEINATTLAAIYISGAPMDLVHALSTVLFLFVLAKPFLEKLERLKVKYGLI